MHLAIPTQKTVLEQLWPALLACALVAVGVVLIPVSYPLVVHGGHIAPDVVAPSDSVAVKWTQDWRERCPITVTREFIGADGFKKTAEPFLYGPPEKLGTTSYEGSMKIPLLPPGRAYYHSIIEPHCWIDKLYQRAYSTPYITVMLVSAPPPPGPR